MQFDIRAVLSGLASELEVFLFAQNDIKMDDCANGASIRFCNPTALERRK